MVAGACAVALAWVMALWAGPPRDAEPPPAPPAFTVVEPLERMADEVERLRVEIAKGDLVLDEIDRTTASLAVEAVSAACESACSARATDEAPMASPAGP